VKIDLITALSSHQVEDQVIAVLLRHDFQLRKRLLSPTDFDLEAMASPTTDRTLIITDHDFGMNWRELRRQSDENLSILVLDISKKVSSDEILQLANQALRGSAEAEHPRNLHRKNSWVLFTGSLGSPGISTLALNTAQEYSKLAQVSLVDADLSHQSLSQMVGERASNQQSSLSRSLSLQSIDALDEIISKEGESVFIDIGSAPLLSQAVSDRRLKGRLFMQALSCCSHLVYVIHQDSHALYQLEEFELALAKFSGGLGVIYILNKESSSPNRPVFRKSFRSKINNQPHFFMPYEYANLERARSRYATLSEVSPRSSLSRAVRELALYLDKMI